MAQNPTDELVRQLLQLKETFEAHVGPFPYEDCRHILESAGVGDSDLIPDLDTYFYEIWSHTTGVKRLLTWPKETLSNSIYWRSMSFFERHPEYRALEPMITASEAPQLHARLELYERARQLLLALLGRLLAQQETDHDRL
jgi:hypothetical protein